VSLITHGLSSIAVYGDIVATRILLVTAILFVTLLFILCIVLLIKIFTNLAIPGWATYVSGLVLISLLQLILIGAVFSMIILSNRNNSNIIPGRDYKDYVDNFFNLKL
jgi:pilus assembly protein TadC